MAMKPPTEKSLNTPPRVIIPPTSAVQDNNPMKASVESAINKRLDREAKDEDGASDLAFVERESTKVIKASDADYYDKVASAMTRAKVARKVRAFKK
jgi:hypothetical protein